MMVQTFKKNCLGVTSASGPRESFFLCLRLHFQLAGHPRGHLGDLSICAGGWLGPRGGCRDRGIWATTGAAAVEAAVAVVAAEVAEAAAAAVVTPQRRWRVRTVSGRRPGTTGCSSVAPRFLRGGLHEGGSGRRGGRQTKGSGRTYFLLPALGLSKRPDQDLWDSRVRGSPH